MISLWENLFCVLYGDGLVVMKFDMFLEFKEVILRCGLNDIVEFGL